MVETVLGVQPPLAVPEQTALPFQSVVQRGGRIGHQDVERGKAELVVHGEFERFLDGLHSVIVVAQRKSRPRLKVMTSKDFALRLVPIPASSDKVGGLFHGFEVPGIQRLEADHITQATALLEQVHQLRVIGHVDGSLGELSSVYLCFLSTASVFYFITTEARSTRRIHGVNAEVMTAII